MTLREMHHEDETKRVLVGGRPDLSHTDNTISTAKYTILTFLPIAIREQFRRNGNVYFLVIGCLMAIGYYSSAFETAISPFTTLGPLAIVVSISLAQEGAADLARHRSDSKTNRYPCVVLRRADDLDASGGQREEGVNRGKDVHVRLSRPYYNRTTGRSYSPGLDGLGVQSSTEQDPSDATSSITRSQNMAQIAFEKVKRMDIRSGHFVIVRNREMIPADLILLASSSENGNAYVETSSIDGETNLKLRTSPHLPKHAVDMGSTMNLSEDAPLNETLEQATKRITRFSALGYPAGISASANAANPVEDNEAGENEEGHNRRESGVIRRASALLQNAFMGRQSQKDSAEGRRYGPGTTFVASLTSEPPNASVNTYSGKLTLPPVQENGRSIDIPLNAENILLRGAVLRNTEWAIGLACFTGTDTKLVQNSFETPSKFSRLDHLINRTVLLILTVMLICVLASAGLSVSHYSTWFNTLWYCGYNEDALAKWPYLPPEFPAPEWDAKAPNFGQQMFLFITLLSNFVPLSMYVTVEIITLYMMYLIGVDRDMYHEDTDTPAVARSTIVTDLGQIQYIFSDKTGTLTQNVMRFKRCSVDGMAFGAPMEKSAPVEKKENATQGNESNDADGVPAQSFLPLNRLLVGAVPFPDTAGDGTTGSTSGVPASTGNLLTFNAEMFLRVMSICHTVVVEKDLDRDHMDEDDDSRVSKSSSLSSFSAKKIFLPKLRSRAGTESSIQSQLDTVDESGGTIDAPALLTSNSNIMEDLNIVSATSTDSQRMRAKMNAGGKSPDGAPKGYAYQAESPDEGALVSAASLTYGFQVLGRSSAGIQLACETPSLLSDESLVKGLKNRTVSLKAIAAKTASPAFADSQAIGKERAQAEVDEHSPRFETWEVLAVNKFDSDRKRMSLLVRSPPELGSIPMLLCKGADSAMLDGKVCEGGEHVMEDETTSKSFEQTEWLQASEGQNPKLSRVSEGVEVGGSNGEIPECIMTSSEVERAEDDWDMTTMLALQAHLGDFASEGLRTLVLGVRILSEEEVDDWLARHKAAAKSIKNREKKLTEVAIEIERGLHIVGATAIEDKLQDGVPDTIHNLEKAGIKLWVLTGDKRETAIEIGYSTKVLTPKMHLAVVSDGQALRIRAQIAMEFIRLVKFGKLPQFRRSVLDEPSKINFGILLNWKKCLRSCRRSLRRTFKHFVLQIKRLLCFCRKESAKDAAKRNSVAMKDVHDRRLEVRKLADRIIEDYLNSPEGVDERRGRIAAREATEAVRQSHEEGFANETGGSPQSPTRKKVSVDGDIDEVSLASDTVPAVFGRASSARAMLDLQRNSGKLTNLSLRALSVASVTSQSASAVEDPIVDEELLSLASFVPGATGDVVASFDKKKRTVLERLFATDRDVRKGYLSKHLTDDKMASLASAAESHDGKVEKIEVTVGGSPSGGQVQHSVAKEASSDASRALVIEGAALAHLLGDPLLEELLFSVASCCDAVIACRVSPKQKALLVKMVRNYVTPEPVTLAIGDGANDVGMIQEAHVGVGISGLEGQQAVNASDFAIAQFRFLQELVLIHGRWNFRRLARVVLFSFYKNAVMIGTLLTFGTQTLYSGTPLYDQWVISMLNFLAGIPILFLGMFDRDLEKDYVRRNPAVYKSGPNNEHLSLRIFFRWVCLVVVHTFTIYAVNEKPLALGGGVTTAFSGLMHNNDRDIPGDGEGGDLKVFGTTIYTCLIFTLAYKVLFESRSIIHGTWPACSCRKGVGEGWPNRLAYTWVGILWGSIGFFFFAMYVYQLVGRRGASSMSPFTMVANHTYNMRSITWMMIILVPSAAAVFDVVGKVYGNMYFPTQTQIHCEIQAAEVARAKKDARERRECLNNGNGAEEVVVESV